MYFASAFIADIVAGIVLVFSWRGFTQVFTLG